MDTVSLTIDEVEVKARKDATILEAAQEAGIYIPSLCAHPDLPSSKEVKPVEVIYRKNQVIKSTSAREYNGCQLCLVEIKGTSEPVTACTTLVEEGMAVHINTTAVQKLRRRNLSLILGNHPHNCLTCAQREGCAREPCSMQIDYNLRCCPLLGRCELQKVADYIGIGIETPRFTFASLPVIEDEPLFKRNYNLCIDCIRCVRVCQEVRGVSALGFVWNGNKAVVGTLAPSLKESGCRFCGACVEVCPTGALTDLGKRSPEEDTVRCKETCPAHIDIPRYIRLITEERFTDALAVIREKVPFPMTLGYVCNHPCEKECLRGDVNEPIAICSLKRFAAEQDGSGETRVASPTGKRVAIVGSGPAGLTAAYYLAKQGHSVTVFEALPEPGGMLRTGIPEYRLPREVLNKEIDTISRIGVDIKLNMHIESLDSLLGEGYNAVFLGLGAHEETRLGADGEELDGVIESVEFLRRVNLREKVDIGDRVGVIGGGNVAIDAARTSKRLGSKKVTIFYRRTRAEMPASSEEIDAALEESVEIVYLVAPTKILQDNSVLKLECQRMELGEPDASGRRRPVPIKDSEFVTELDTVVIAIGQRPQVPESLGVETGKGNIIKVDGNMMTTRKGVFSGGDAVSGAASVIKAIAAGRKAASSIDKYLGGEGNIDEVLVETAKPGAWIGREDGFADKSRVLMPCLEVEERLKDFSNVELGFSREMAVKEARRCLQCDLRLQLSSPALPPEKTVMQDFTPENIGAVPEIEGVIQLFNKEKEIIYIAGTTNLREALLEFADNNEVCYFFFEESDMYTSKQDELTQQYMQEHGSMPKLNDSMLDDLF